MTNLLIELDGDVAIAESYCITFGRIKADGSNYHSFVGARMIDRLERRDGRWGIAYRQLIWDWSHDAPAAEHWMRGLLAPDPSVLRMSQKYPADPIYAPRLPRASTSWLIGAPWSIRCIPVPAIHR